MLHYTFSANIFAKMFPERNFCKAKMFPERKFQTLEMFPVRKFDTALFHTAFTRDIAS